MGTRLVWIGDGAPRMEVAHVERRPRDFSAVGTQLGSVYELRYRLEPDRLTLDLVGENTLELSLEGADFFDLGFSALFNSLPVIRDELLRPGPAREYTMRLVSVPSLEVIRSAQRYEPLGSGQIRFTAGEFAADIRFDELGYVVDYPGIATRV